MTLDDSVYDHLVAKARASYEQQGKHTPLLIAFGESGQVGLISLHHFLDDHYPRDLTYAVLRHMLKALCADSYVVISETWMSLTTMPPSKDPQRIECLWVLGVFASRRRKGTMMKVKKGKVFGEPMISEDSGEAYGGGFGELLTGRDISDQQLEAVAKTLAKQLSEQVTRN